VAGATCLGVAVIRDFMLNASIMIIKLAVKCYLFWTRLLSLGKSHLVHIPIEQVHANGTLTLRRTPYILIPAFVTFLSWIYWLGTHAFNAGRRTPYVSKRINIRRL